MQYTYRTFSKLFLALPFLLITTNAFAQDPTPSGKVAIESTSIAVGIGVSWGDGTLSLDGKDYKFSVSGLTVIDVGIAKASAVGDVYNLTDVSMLPGTYVAAEVGFALAGGMGGIAVRNQNGVIIHLRSVQQGARLQLGPSGFSVKMK